MIQVLILHECVLPKRKSDEAHRRAPSCVLMMTLKQTVRRSWISDDIENSQEERTHAKSELVSLLLVVFTLCTWMNLIENFHNKAKNF